jgi:hypothetical protein
MKVKTTKISATSRASIKMLVHGKEQYFTVEYSEERTVDYADGEENDKVLDDARKDLWDVCNAEVDNQLQEIQDTFKK